MKIYIAGKITGDINYRLKFRAAERRLKKEGHAVLNPAVLPKGLEAGDYVRICLAMMQSAEAAAFLPDWTESHGARIEHLVCEYMGKEVIYL